MILKVFLKRKLSGDISVEYLDNIWAVLLGKYLGGISRRIWGGSLEKYLGSISEKNLRVITGEVFVGYFEEDFGENIDHYILFVDISSGKQIFWNEIWNSFWI
jgi:hypothetical protein